MMNIKKYIGWVALAFSLTIHAQTTISFEDAGQYKSLGVYDSWVESPFRTSELSGNVKVITNELTDENPIIGTAPNPSSKILAFQRSRWGGNLFGARIDLTTPLLLSPTPQYAHVFIHKEKAGRVMLIGLGRRTERPHQQETEQFNSLSIQEVGTGEWYDAVFAIQSAEGVEIHTLVVVPDCESPHNLDNDFVAYIDEIVINNSSSPRVSYETYPVNFDKSSLINREQYNNDRYTNSIGFNSPSGGNQSLSVNQETSKLVYNEIINSAFLAKAGETVTPSIGYTGRCMHSYIYLDKGQDGQFSFDLNDDNDVMSYSYYQGVDSKNQTVSDNCTALQPPTFQIPSDLENGFYRMRYKIDWDNLDPGGTGPGNNYIADNGGIIVDTRVNIHGDQVKIYRANTNGGGLNGDILKADGSAFTTENIPFGQAYTIKSLPAPGFHLSHLIIRHGHNLEGDSILYGTPQYVDIRIPASSFVGDSFTIPAAYIDGDVRIIPYFSSGETTEPEEVTYCTPTFTDDAGSNRYRYMTSITSSGTQGTPLNYTNSSYSERYVVLDEPLTVEQGSNFTLVFETYNAGSSDGMQYTHAEIFADWDGNGNFEDSNEYNDLNSGEWVAKIGNDHTVSGFDNKVGNGDLLYEIAQSFSVPANSVIGVSRIRILYTDAWHSNGDGGCSTTHGPCVKVHKGLVYDIPLVIKTPESDIQEEVAQEAIKIYSVNDKIVVESQERVAISVYTTDGTLVENTNSVGYKTMQVPTGIYIVRVNDKAQSLFVR